MSKVDNRGSDNQRTLYKMLKELYPLYDIVYEYQLPNGTRLDLFIPTIGIAVEYDGEQHYRYTEFWHKDINGFLDQKKSDLSKDDYCYRSGIKLVRVPFNKMVANSEELKALIDKTEFPDVEYNLYVFDSEEKKKDEFLKKRKESQKESWKKYYNEQKEKRKHEKRKKLNKINSRDC